VNSPANIVIAVLFTKLVPLVVATKPPRANYQDEDFLQPEICGSLFEGGHCAWGRVRKVNDKNRLE
jgi:hypothetical protein